MRRRIRPAIPKPSGIGKKSSRRQAQKQTLKKLKYAYKITNDSNQKLKLRQLIEQAQEAVKQGQDYQPEEQQQQDIRMGQLYDHVDTYSKQYDRKQAWGQILDLLQGSLQDLDLGGSKRLGSQKFKRFKQIRRKNIRSKQWLQQQPDPGYAQYWDNPDNIINERPLQGDGNFRQQAIHLFPKNAPLFVKNYMVRKSGNRDKMVYNQQLMYKLLLDVDPDFQKYFKTAAQALGNYQFWKGKLQNQGFYWDPQQSVWKQKISNPHIQKLFNGSVSSPRIPNMTKISQNVKALKQSYIRTQNLPQQLRGPVNIMLAGAKQLGFNPHFGKINLNPERLSKNFYIGAFIDPLTGQVRLPPKPLTSIVNPINRRSVLQYKVLKSMYNWNSAMRQLQSLDHFTAKGDKAWKTTVKNKRKNNNPLLRVRNQYRNIIKKFLLSQNVYGIDSSQDIYMDCKNVLVNDKSTQKQIFDAIQLFIKQVKDLNDQQIKKQVMDGQKIGVGSVMRSNYLKNWNANPLVTSYKWMQRANRTPVKLSKTWGKVQAYDDIGMGHLNYLQAQTSFNTLPKQLIFNHPQQLIKKRQFQDMDKIVSNDYMKYSYPGFNTMRGAQQQAKYMKRLGIDLPPQQIQIKNDQLKRFVNKLWKGDRQGQFAVNDVQKDYLSKWFPKIQLSQGAQRLMLKYNPRIWFALNKKQIAQLSNEQKRRVLQLLQQQNLLVPQNAGKLQNMIRATRGSIQAANNQIQDQAAQFQVNQPEPQSQQAGGEGDQILNNPLNQNYQNPPINIPQKPFIIQPIDRKSQRIINRRLQKPSIKQVKPLRKSIIKDVRKPFDNKKKQLPKKMEKMQIINSIPINQPQINNSSIKINQPLKKSLIMQQEPIVGNVIKQKYQIGPKKQGIYDPNNTNTIVRQRLKDPLNIQKIKILLKDPGLNKSFQRNLQPKLQHGLPKQQENRYIQKWENIKSRNEKILTKLMVRNQKQGRKTHDFPKYLVGYKLKEPLGQKNMFSILMKDREQSVISRQKANQKFHNQLAQIESVLDQKKKKYENYPSQQLKKQIKKLQFLQFVYQDPRNALKDPWKIIGDALNYGKTVGQKTLIINQLKPLFEKGYPKKGGTIYIPWKGQELQNDSQWMNGLKRFLLRKHIVGQAPKTWKGDQLKLWQQNHFTYEQYNDMINLIKDSSTLDPKIKQNLNWQNALRLLFNDDIQSKQLLQTQWGITKKPVFQNYYADSLLRRLLQRPEYFIRYNLPFIRNRFLNRGNEWFNIQKDQWGDDIPY